MNRRWVAWLAGRASVFPKSVAVLATAIALSAGADAQTLVLAQPTSPTQIGSPLSLLATVANYETSEMIHVVQFRAAGTTLLGAAPPYTAVTYGECSPPAVSAAPQPGGVKIATDVNAGRLPQGGSGFAQQRGNVVASNKAALTATLCPIGSTTSAGITLSSWPLKAGTYALDAVLVAKAAPTIILAKSNVVTLVVADAASGLQTTIGLRSSANPTLVAGNTNLSASVTPANATGSVTFRDGGTVLGTVLLTSGSATFVASFAAAGTHTLTATLNPGAGFLASTSPAISQNVVASAAQPAVTVSVDPKRAYEYDANGNTTRTIDAPEQAGYGFATTTTFDALQLARQVTDAKGAVTRLAYDGLSRLTDVTDPRGLVTSTPRSGLGDIAAVVSPDTGRANLSYDVAGRVSTRTDSRGVETSFAYDELSRVTRVSHAQGTLPAHTTTFAYDEVGTGFSNGIGRLTSSTWPSGGAQYAYDSLGRITQYTQRVSASPGANGVTIASIVRYAYDGAGNLASLTYPSGRVLTISRSNGQATSLAIAHSATAAATVVADQLRYTPEGALERWRSFALGQPQPYSITYDTNGRPVRYPLGRVVRDLTYDAAGRISAYRHFDALTGAPSNALDQTFGYDETGRITRVTLNGVTTTYSYDANGNRTATTTGTTTRTYTTQAASNRLAAVSNPARTLGYDAMGNTTADTSLGYAATYDLSGRLTQLVRGGTTTNFAYDADGRRIRKFSSTAATSATIFAYDNESRLLGEYDVNGRAIREYIWLDDQPFAVLVTPANGDVAAAELLMVHSDHLATPQVLLDKHNAVRWQWLTEPFGTTAPNVDPQGYGAVTFNLRFPGQYADVETGLFYNHNRDYDPSTGRYVQSDPIGLAGGLNTYVYVDGSPVFFVDRDGTIIQLAPMLGGAAFGALTDVGLQLLGNGGNWKCIKWGEVGVAAGLGAVSGGLSGLNRFRVLMGTSGDVAKEAARAGGGVITGYAQSGGAIGKVVTDAYGVSRGRGMTVNGVIWLGLRFVGTHLDDVSKGVSSGNALAMERLIKNLIPRQLGPGAAGGIAARSLGEECDCK